MAFNNIVFPDYPMIHGVSKTITDPVNISSNGTYEYRIKRTEWERYSWNIPTQTMTEVQKETMKSFLIQRNHALNSFKFVDPDATDFADAIMSHDTGDYWKLNLPFDASTAGTHPIFNPDVAQLSVTVDTVSDTINTLDLSTGYPRIQIIGTSGSEVVKVTGPIFFTVRLATNFSYALYALDNNNKGIGHQVSDIELVEVYGEY